MDEVQGIETVYIPEPDRGTLCISSQVGCAMDCSFCSTAQQGFNRNLSVAEIVGQVWLAHRELAEARADGRADHQRRVHGHGRAARQLPQRRAGHAHFHGRSGLRPVAPPGDLEHLRAGAADLQARRGMQRRARGVAACAERRAAQRARADQPQASDRANCWRHAGTTSTSRTAAASPSSTSCSTASTTGPSMPGSSRACCAAGRPSSI